MLWAISGGAGFLGLHLARRLLADGHEVRTLDLAPLDDPRLEGEVEELRGDVRDPVAAAGLVARADVLVHAAAALPILASREAIRSVNVDGTAVTLAVALEAGVGRTVLISTTAVYGVPKHHPIAEDAPLVGVGHYGESKIEAEHVARDAGRRGLDVVVLRALERARLSPLAEWHYRTAHRDSFVDVTKAQRLLGFAPRLSNEQALCETYDWYLTHREEQRGVGVTH